MKRIRHLTMLTAILLSCIVVFVFAEDMAKARILYNGKEVSLESKPLMVDGSNYLSVRALAVLFDKNIEWNHKEQKILISDKPDPVLESLKSELAGKNKSIAELEEKVKKLESDMESAKKLSIRELQDLINSENGEYEGVSYKVVLSGNEDEIKVIIEVDLSWDKAAWGRLNSNKKKEMIKEICNAVSGEYAYVRINGCIKDISGSKKLLTFHNNIEGEIEIGNYNNLSTTGRLEDMLNDEYSDYFKGVHFSYTLKGNENRMEYTAYVQKSRFEEKWDKISENALKIFMRKLCGEIAKEFKKCHIAGSIYDADSGSELVSCEQAPGEEFYFSGK